MNRLAAGARHCVLICCALALAACAGAPVKFAATPAPTSSGPVVTAEACGFQLLLFIPIMVNSRLERAYQALREHAPGAALADIEMSERWSYGLVGTVYCTTLRGRVVGS